jgi:hypothetical protein
LRPGRYQITVSKPGFRSQTNQVFDLRVQDRLEINLQLEVGATNSANSSDYFQAFPKRGMEFPKQPRLQFLHSELALNSFKQLRIHVLVHVEAMAKLVSN